MLQLHGLSEAKPILTIATRDGFRKGSTHPTGRDNVRAMTYHRSPWGACDVKSLPPAKVADSFG